MSKKQIMKNIKKNSKNSIKKVEKDSFFKFITTLMIMILIFILVYFLIGVFYTKEIDFKSDKDKEIKDEVTVDNSTITLGQMFDQSQDEYYVLVYDINDDKSIIPSWLSIFESKNSNATIYKVDSKNKFNAEFLTNEGGNKNAKSYSELKVKAPTLIKLNNKTISDYIEGEESIKEYFKNN